MAIMNDASIVITPGTMTRISVEAVLVDFLHHHECGMRKEDDEEEMEMEKEANYTKADCMHNEMKMKIKAGCECSPR